MPDLELVHKIPSPPGTCLLCGSTPVDETTEGTPPLPMIWAPGLDVNWGEFVTICVQCVGLMADMIDRPSEEAVEKVRSRATFEKKRADKAATRVDELEARITKILEGKKAVREAREDKK